MFTHLKHSTRVAFKKLVIYTKQRQPTITIITEHDNEFYDKAGL